MDGRVVVPVQWEADEEKERKRKKKKNAFQLHVATWLDYGSQSHTSLDVTVKVFF